MQPTFRCPAQLLELRSHLVRSFTASTVVLSLLLLGIACSDPNPFDPTAGADDDGAAEADSLNGGDDDDPEEDPNAGDDEEGDDEEEGDDGDEDPEDSNGFGNGPIELGTLGGTFSVATAINDNGDVVGYSETATGEMRAFLWTADEGMRNLGTPARESRAFGINNHREIVGWFQGDLGRMPFLWTADEGMVDISDFWPGLAFDINDHGRVAGTHRPEQTAATYTRGEGWIRHGCPDFSFLYAINDRDEAVGYHQANMGLVSPEYPDGRGPLPSTGLYVSGPGADCQDLRDEEWFATRAMGITDDGRIGAAAAPSRYVTAQGFQHVEFLETLQPTLLSEAGTPEFAGGFPVESVPWEPRFEVQAMNHAGVIVGYRQETPTDPRHAFRWTPGSDVTLIEVPGVASSAMDINTAGDIVGWMRDEEGRTHAVLWTDRMDLAEAAPRVAATGPRVMLHQRSHSHPEVARCPEPLRELVRLRALDECPVPAS